MAVHARLAPSSAEKWIACSGAPAAEAGVTDQASEFAAEGTAAHQIRSECLDLGMDAYDFVGHRVTVERGKFTFTVTEEMADFLQPGIDRIRELPGRLYVEKRVSLKRWIPGTFGTLDAGIVDDEWITINDLKYGQGIPVSVEHNKQLMLYALGFWDTIARHRSKAKWFQLMIDQPRVAGRGGEPWVISLKDLLAFGEEVAEAARRTKDPDAPRCAGEHCEKYFCKAIDICPTHDAYMLSMLGQEFEGLDDTDELVLPAMAGLTPKRKCLIVRHKDAVCKWLERLHADVLDDALAGRPTPGLKAIDGRRGPRQWADSEKAEALLLDHLEHDQCFTKKLITPTEAEKRLGKAKKDILTGYTTQSDPKPILVPEEDKRDALTPLAELFED